MTRIRTSLEGRQPTTPWDEDELRAKAARLWHQTGTLMVRPEWLHDSLDRQCALNIGALLYGKRQNTRQDGGGDGEKAAQLKQFVEGE